MKVGSHETATLDQQRCRDHLHDAPVDGCSRENTDLLIHASYRESPSKPL